jgi:phage gp29-like protein
MPSVAVLLLVGLTMMSTAGVAIVTAVEPDTHVAADKLPALLRKAEAGDSEAQFELGYIYANGRNVPKDEKLAVEWYRKAADQGHIPAQVNLGVMYDSGLGTPENVRSAFELFRKTADQGDARAQHNLGTM